ncbi:MAG: TRAP transporter substrate-binding protein [Moorellaceae bacterium]
MKKRAYARGFAAAFIFLLLALLAGCGGGGTKEGGQEPAKQSEGKVYELKFATMHPAESEMMKLNEAWKNWIEKESGGRIKITLLPAEQAAKGTELYDAVMNGTVDIACQMIGLCPGRWPLTEVTDLPFILDNPGSRAAALTAWELFKKYPELQAEHQGVKVIGFHANGLQHIHTTKKPVRTMEDLRGMVLCTAGKYSVGAVKLLGGTPETIAPGEKYDAMAKGVVEGNLSEWEGQYAFKLYELTKYSTEVGISLYTFIHVMNLDTWNSLPPDLQQLFSDDNCRLYSMLQGYNFDKRDLEYKKQLNDYYTSKGLPGVYELPQEEREKWKAAVLPLHEEWVKAAAAKIGEEKARAILEDAKQLAKQFAGYPDQANPEAAQILHGWGMEGY